VDYSFNAPPTRNLTGAICKRTLRKINCTDIRNTHKEKRQRQQTEKESIFADLWTFG